MTGVQETLAAAKHDLAAACRLGLAHGLLVTLRYLAPSIPWRHASSLQSSDSLQAWMTRLLSLLVEAGKVAMPVLCHPRAGFGGEACTLTCSKSQDA